MYTILLIEDEPAYQKILKEALEKELFKVVLASDGKQGIIEATRNLPDFILLDLMMPGMNGITFLRHINSVRGLSKVPIAVLTVVPEGVPQKLQGEGPFKNIIGYWIKDTLTPEKITQKVKECLNEQAIRQSQKQSERERSQVI